MGVEEATQVHVDPEAAAVLAALRPFATPVAAGGDGGEDLLLGLGAVFGGKALEERLPEHLRCAPTEERHSSGIPEGDGAGGIGHDDGVAHAGEDQQVAGPRFLSAVALRDFAGERPVGAGELARAAFDEAFDVVGAAGRGADEQSEQQGGGCASDQGEPGASRVARSEELGVWPDRYAPAASAVFLHAGVPGLTGGGVDPGRGVESLGDAGGGIDRIEGHEEAEPLRFLAGDAHQHRRMDDALHPTHEHIVRLAEDREDEDDAGGVAARLHQAQRSGGRQAAAGAGAGQCGHGRAVVQVETVRDAVGFVGGNVGDRPVFIGAGGGLGLAAGLRLDDGEVGIAAGAQILFERGPVGSAHDGHPFQRGQIRIGRAQGTGGVFEFFGGYRGGVFEEHAQRGEVVVGAAAAQVEEGVDGLRSLEESLIPLAVLGVVEPEETGGGETGGQQHEQASDDGAPERRWGGDG